MPIAVVEKGKAPGAHLLSGAVVNPRAFATLFPGMRTEDMPFIEPVEREGVYYLSRRGALRIPAPPPMWNHGNYVASVDEIGRWLAERAEELGVDDRPGDVGDVSCSSRAAASSASAPATRAAAATGRSSRTSSPART